MSTKLIIEFEVPDGVSEFRSAMTATHDLLMGRGYMLFPMPLKRGDRFPIVSQRAGEADPMLTYVTSRYEVDG